MNESSDVESFGANAGVLRCDKNTYCSEVKPFALSSSRVTACESWISHGNIGGAKILSIMTARGSEKNTLLSFIWWPRTNNTAATSDKAQTITKDGFFLQRGLFKYASIVMSERIRSVLVWPPFHANQKHQDALVWTDKVAELKPTGPWCFLTQQTTVNDCTFPFGFKTLY